MKKILLFAVVICFGIGASNAAIRVETNNNRNTQQSRATRHTQTPLLSEREKKQGNIISRATVSKGNTVPQTNSRNSANTASRTTVTSRASGQSASVARTASNIINRNTKTSGAVRSSRAAILTINDAANSKTFGTGYNACRDAYFSCMDQFCANQNDTYRRCVCSSKLGEIQSRERALSQTETRLQDFKDLNISIISKTSGEVKSMLTTSSGETGMHDDDKSNSSNLLSEISDILQDSKSKSLSTSGTLDIAGDINSIWATTNLAGGINISNITGESLYNAVHTQCAEMVADNCPSNSTLNMVISAYGMYIENDCVTLISALDKQLNQANAAIRQTESEMQHTRLETYNTHNSDSITECIASVRDDITADTACGTDYVHCLDITGLYLNRSTGVPIYSANFYQLEYQTSLSGDILKNSENRSFIEELNRKREYAAQSLDKCRDISDDVWDEFMRQAITEIHQGQLSKIRQVKNECLDVVNQCYNTQSESLRQLGETLLGQRLELSEEMCQEKLLTCSNLYGNGNESQGLELLLSTMRNITSQTIAQECRSNLERFVINLCTPSRLDTLHAYPYECRTYAPGEQRYMGTYACNQEYNKLIAAGYGVFTITDETGNNNMMFTPPASQPPIIPNIPEDNTNINYLNDGKDSSTPGIYDCPTCKMYTSCASGYFLAVQNSSYDWIYQGNPIVGNSCISCETIGCLICEGGTARPAGCNDPENPGIDQPSISCGNDYIGSLRQKLVQQALQTCVRPSDASKTDYVLPTDIQGDINVVMDSVRAAMSSALSVECERLGGKWVTTPWQTGIPKHKEFYSETGANTQWGYCTNFMTPIYNDPEAEENGNDPATQ